MFLTDVHLTGSYLPAHQKTNLASNEIFSNNKPMCTIYLAIKAWKKNWLRCQYSQAVICRILFTQLLYCSFFGSFLYLKSNSEINSVVLNKSVLPSFTAWADIKEIYSAQSFFFLDLGFWAGRILNVKHFIKCFFRKMSMTLEREIENNLIAVKLKR